MANVHTWKVLKDSAGTALSSVQKTATFNSQTLKPGDATVIGILVDLETDAGGTLDIKAQIAIDGGTDWLDCYPEAVASETQFTLTQITGVGHFLKFAPNWCAPQSNASVNPVMRFVFTMATTPDMTMSVHVAFLKDRPVI